MQTAALRAKPGTRLVPLPPSLAFDAGVVDAFASALGMRSIGGVTCDPRRASWFAPEADRLLMGLESARVAALRAVVPKAAGPGGGKGLVYHRLYGSPKVYDSAYPNEYLDARAAKLTRSMAVAPARWIFDNTAIGAAMADALAVVDRLRGWVLSQGWNRGNRATNSGQPRLIQAWVVLRKMDIWQAADHSEANQVYRVTILGAGTKAFTRGA